jgi:hypothetical protein
VRPIHLTAREWPSARRLTLAEAEEVIRIESEQLLDEAMRQLATHFEEFCAIEAAFLCGLATHTICFKDFHED